jgi:diamine N-acetyltransferase
MYGYNFAYVDMQAFIIRLMVDENQQGKGFGRFGMNWMLECFRKDERISTVGISYEPENDVARKLYASLGFIEPGKMVDGETLAILKLR